MKKAIFLVLISALVITSCFNKKNISVSFKENENKFEMNAVYRPARTQKIEHYMQSKMLTSTVFNKVESNTNAVLVEDGDARFYLQSSKGNLHIKLNKNENSEQSYNRVKEMCEEIKEIIAQ